MVTKRIKMLKTTPGSPDGLNTLVYETGQEYDVPEGLVRAFVDELEVAEHAQKMMRGAPANKDAGPAPVDKIEESPVEEEKPKPVIKKQKVQKKKPLRR